MLADFVKAVRVMKNPLPGLMRGQFHAYIPHCQPTFVFNKDLPALAKLLWQVRVVETNFHVPPFSGAGTDEQLAEAKAYILGKK